MEISRVGTLPPLTGVLRATWARSVSKRSLLGPSGPGFRGRGEGVQRRWRGRGGGTGVGSMSARGGANFVFAAEFISPILGHPLKEC